MPTNNNSQEGASDKRFIVFEKEALERLSSRSDLKKPMPIIGLPIKLAAITGIATVVTGIAWSLFARVPLEVTGLGVIAPEHLSGAQARIDGILRIQVPGAGKEQLTTQERKRNSLVGEFWIKENSSLKNEASIEKITTVISAALNENLGQPFVIPESLEGAEMPDKNIVKSQGLEQKLFYPAGTVIAVVNNNTERETLNVALRELAPINSIKKRQAKTSKYTAIKFDQITGEHQNQIKNQERILAYKKALYNKMLDLYKNGYISAQALLEEKSLLSGAKSELISKKEQKLNTQVSKLSEDSQSRQEEYEEKEVLNKLELSIVKFLDSSYIISPVGGMNIIGINFPNGSRVKAGEEIVNYSIQKPRLPSIVPVFLDSKSTQQIAEGMKVLLTPQGISRAEYGGIEGQVVEVNKLPLSKEALKGSLGTQALQEKIEKNIDTPHIIRVKLKVLKQNYCEQKASYRCYQWTTNKIPPQPVKIGSIADVQITTIYRRPIEFVLPALRKALGLVRDNK